MTIREQMAISFIPGSRGEGKYIFFHIKTHYLTDFVLVLKEAVQSSSTSFCEYIKIYSTTRRWRQRNTHNSLKDHFN